MSKTLHSPPSLQSTCPRLIPVPLQRQLRRNSTVCLKELQTEKLMTSTVAITVANCVLPQLASAAQEVIQLAEGEPLIVQAGWAALAASFTMSIAIVVWGRSGL
eukprot:g4759.t1